MTSPVDLTDLDLALTADDNDLTLVRKNDTTDYKVRCSAMRNINVAALPVMTTSPTALDLLIVSQAGTNRQCNFGSIGFVIGTTLWFHSSDAPNGVSPIFWRIVPNLGDRLLAVKGATGQYMNGGGVGGTWLQEGVGGGVPGGGLTIAQMPSHTHEVKSGDASSGSGNVVKGYNNDDFNPNNKRWLTQSRGGGQPHNHGETWRPLANVGVICTKVL